MTRNAMQRFGGRRGTVLALVAFLVADLVFAAAFHVRSVNSAAPISARALVAVLYADAPPALDRTRPALDRAIELYRGGAIRRVICVGGNRPGMRWHAGDGMRAYLVAAGIPVERVIVETMSYDTRSNVVALGRLLTEEPQTRLLVIAYPAHQRRVAYHAARLIRGAELEFAAPPAHYSWNGFADTWKAVHHEAAAWLLTLLLSERAFDVLVLRLRASALQEPLPGSPRG